jgi:phosphoribosylaminoimidazole carboxylase PurE protein
VLDEYGIAYEMNVMSAHRTPARVAEYSSTAADRGLKVIIAGAGLAAHLAGAVAANTTLPVIGVPLDAGSIGGLDSLLATVQMPKGVPVATVAIGKHGAKNAAHLAAQILALGDPELAATLRANKKQS